MSLTQNKGLPALVALQLATCIHKLQMKVDLSECLPNVFKDLGNLGDEFQFTLRPEAKPFALSVWECKNLKTAK